MTENAPPLSQALWDVLAVVELPTLGHFLEDGFCDPDIRLVGSGVRMTGIAVTVDLTTPDAIAVNQALMRLTSGSVLVIRVNGRRHAPVGAVTAAAAIARGAAGIVVDGPVTDASALRESAAVLPVFARGFTALTTKRLGTATGGVGAPVQIGGVVIADGDIVAGDENGVLAFPPSAIDPSLIEAARRSDLAEPDLIRRIRRGDPLDTLLALTPPTSP